MRTMNYLKQGKLIFEVRTMYDENRSLSELKANKIIILRYLFQIKVLVFYDIIK